MAEIGFEGYQLGSSVKENPSVVSSSPQSENNDDLLLAHHGPGGSPSSVGSYADLFFRDGQRRIDFVLAYDATDTSDKDWQQTRADKRAAFQDGLVERGLELEEEDNVAVDLKTHFVKVHAPFGVLTRWAEQLRMSMPIAENNAVTHSLLDRAIDKCCSNNIFDPDIEPQPDQFTAPFIRAKLSKFLNYQNEDGFFSPAQRSYIVHEIMCRTPYIRVSSRSAAGTKIGIDRLVGNKAYTAAFPLHEGGWGERATDNLRKTLFNVWGSWRAWYKFQPLDHVRIYFGEKIGIYFTWLGFYTAMLVVPALLGFIVFLAGCAAINTNEPAKEICKIEDMDKRNASYRQFIMCPLCDKTCDYWSLGSTCKAAKASFLFDNIGTVFFAIVMSFWATFFLEFWKRRQAQLAYDWDVMSFEEEEEHPRARFEARIKTLHTNPVTGIEEPYQPRHIYYSKISTALAAMAFMVGVVLAALFSVVVYRVAVLTSLNERRSMRSSASFITSVTAALIQLIIILLLTKVYEWLAVRLTEWECHRTQTEHEDSFTFKMFLFQFVNYYGSIFYIAFFKGRLVGYPGNYNRIGKKYRLDECSPSGCLIELTIQLAIIMVGKQILNNIIEIVMPRVKVWFRRRDNVVHDEDEEAAKKALRRWEEDFDLADLPEHGLFYEYLEMVLQFGFITLFVAAFPLAPLFALLNNVLEIRVDSNKFVTQLRRPLARRAEDIGIWLPILGGIANLSVLTNALVIAITSDFIPRLAYTYGVDDKPGIHPPDKHTLDGFVAFSLSQANISDIADKSIAFNDSAFLHDAQIPHENFTHCSFRGYRGGDGKPLSEQKRFYWQTLCARFIFVIVFEHVVFGVKAIIAWLVPDVPQELQNAIEREKYLAKQALREFDERPEACSRNELIVENM